MKKAWEYNREFQETAIPFPERAARVSWHEVIRDGERDLLAMIYMWGGNVTESLFPLFNIPMYIQEYENLGYDVSKAEAMIEEGRKIAQRKDTINLYRYTVRLLHELYQSPKNPNHPYWKYAEYKSWDQYLKSVKMPEKTKYDISGEDFHDRINAGWMAQICAGAVGTAIEGFHTLKIEEVFGKVDRYIKEPEMYNDDLTFELAFLETFIRCGYSLKSADVAEDWAALIPFAFTAEGIALRNIKSGFYPPESAYLKNAMREMIGAQMRGAICGMLAPGDVKTAAYLAWQDAEVSHGNNGILGEIFNAVMASMAFVETDMKTICKKAIELIPADSQYRSVVNFAWKTCEKSKNWRDAWLICDEEYKQYNWIHCYPNACAEVVALYFCENDYDKLVTIIAMCGLDSDCNAAQIAAVLAISQGSKSIDKKWTDPIGDRMETYVRGMDIVRIPALVQKTVDAVRNTRGSN